MAGRRTLTRRAKKAANSNRLQNACWRSWTKFQYRLATVAPESLIWFKDCDATWLYGPLHDCAGKGSPHSGSLPASEGVSPLSICKKPILKKASSWTALSGRLSSHKASLHLRIKVEQPDPVNDPRLTGRIAGSALPSCIHHCVSTAATGLKPTDTRALPHPLTLSDTRVPTSSRRVQSSEEVKQVQAVDGDFYTGGNERAGFFATEAEDDMVY
jgi:hypothetical protein